MPRHEDVAVSALCAQCSAFTASLCSEEKPPRGEDQDRGPRESGTKRELFLKKKYMFVTADRFSGILILVLTLPQVDYENSSGIHPGKGKQTRSPGTGEGGDWWS